MGVACQQQPSRTPQSYDSAAQNSDGEKMQSSEMDKNETQTGGS